MQQSTGVTQMSVVPKANNTISPISCEKDIARDWPVSVQKGQQDSLLTCLSIEKTKKI